MKTTRQSWIRFPSIAALLLFWGVACGTPDDRSGPSGGGDERARNSSSPGTSETIAEGPSPGLPAADTAAGVRPGIDVLLADSIHLVVGRRVGLVTNHTGIDAAGVASVDRLHDQPEIELVALYSPEHGIRGTAEAGVLVDHSRDEATGLPVHSLYGETRKPTSAMLEGVEVLLFDIQDIGTRYYTYIYTMGLAMEAAGEAGIPFVVLDRPNPVDGVQVQGNVLDPAYASFVGVYPLPMRHGMTPGELARLYRSSGWVEAELVVVPGVGWRRDALFPQTGLPWLPPSPNMPDLESALHYPGTCLFEGTNLSVGRGTARAFQQIGAPWLDGSRLAERMRAHDLPGVDFEAVRFTPSNPGDGKFGGEEVGGVRLRVTDPHLYDPTVTGVALLVESHRLAGERWSWRTEHFDRLAGTDALRLGIVAGFGVEAITSGWAEELEAFRVLREAALIYP